MIQLERQGDVRIVEQSIRNNWKLPEKAMADLPARLLEIVLARDGDPQSGPYVHPTRMRLSAMRCLLMMNQQNILANPMPQQLDVNVNGHFAFDMDTASEMSREDMAKVADAMRLLSNGRNGNGAAQVH